MIMILLIKNIEAPLPGLIIVKLNRRSLLKKY